MCNAISYCPGCIYFVKPVFQRRFFIHAAEDFNDLNLTYERTVLIKRIAFNFVNNCCCEKVESKFY